MNQEPSAPNLHAARQLLGLMIWVIIIGRFETIRWSCETLIVFVSRVWLRELGGESGLTRFKDCALVISFTLRDRLTAAEGSDVCILRRNLSKTRST